MRSSLVTAVGVSCVLLSACVSGNGSAPETPAMACEASAVQSALGQFYSASLAEQLRRSANAREVRRLTPDTVTTMEFQADRLNVVVDRANRVSEVRCG